VAGTRDEARLVDGADAYPAVAVEKENPLRPLTGTHDRRCDPARRHEPQSGTREAGLGLVVSKICAGGYGAGRVREQSPRGEERVVR
jgi:hypothetical protein